MKFLITFVSLCMTSIFYISKANTEFFILVHSRMRGLQFNKKWIPTSYFHGGRGPREAKTICEKLKKAKIFIADRPITLQHTSGNEVDETSNYLGTDFFINEAWNSQTNETVLGKVTRAELLFHDQKIKTFAVACEFGTSEKDKVYVARQGGSKHLFLFGKSKTDETDNNTLPNFLAVGMNYIKIETVKQNVLFKDVIWEYIHKHQNATSCGVAKKLFEEDDVDIFQLCASLVLFEEKKDDKNMKYTYIITIPGSKNNLGVEVPITNIVNFMYDLPAEKSVPALTCRIKQKADNENPIKFKFYIVPDISILETTDSRIIVTYDYFNGSKVTHINKHYTLSAPWKFINRKHALKEGEK